jgi:hypothetical protein
MDFGQQESQESILKLQAAFGMSKLGAGENRYHHDVNTS